MQRKSKGILLAVLLGLIVPLALIKISVGLGKENPEPTEVSTEPETQNQTDETIVDTPILMIPVLFENGEIQQMDLETYITGVVLAEMPANFEKEALKAQAVVARTYALKGYYGKEKHANRAICTDPSCCQAYCTSEKFLSSGGTGLSLEKVQEAVSKTKNLVLTYNGELIDATYFSCSGGKTEDAQAVWGTDIPYLQSVASPGEEKATHYMDTVFFTRQEFADCMGLDKSKLKGDWIGDISYTEGGGVDRIFICNQEYTGTQIRQLLGLRSTAFVITAIGESVTVTTKGFGHRVGMSQYGAEAMAVSGKDFAEILAYYYQNTVLDEFVN